MERMTITAEEIIEGDVLDDGAGKKWRVVELEHKPKTIVLHLEPANRFSVPFRCKRGEHVEVERPSTL